MKIVFIDPQSYEGLASYDHSLISNMLESKVILMGNKLFEFAKEERAYEFLPVFKYNRMMQPFKTLSYIKSLRTVMTEIVKEKPDAVHFQWFKAPKADLLLLKRVKRLGIPIVITAHNILPHDTEERYLSDYRKIYRSASRIIVHTDHSKSEMASLMRIKEEKISVIPHGTHRLRIDEEAFSECLNRIAKLLNKERRLVFSFLGHISYYKGIDLIIEAWENSKRLQKDEQILLLVAGRGNYPSNELSKLAKFDNVLLDIRGLSNEEFEAYLELSDAMLLPYRQISQSGIMLSAINRSKPFIVSKVGGLTDPFSYFKECGWIMDNHDWRSIEKAIYEAKVSLEKHSNTSDSEEGWKKLQEAYSWERIGQMTEELYEHVRKGNSPQSS